MTLKTFLELRNTVIAVFMIVIVVGGAFWIWRKQSEYNDLRKQETEITYITEEYECINIESTVTENYNGEEQEHFTYTLRNIETGEEKTTSSELVQGERYMQHSAEITYPVAPKLYSSTIHEIRYSDFNATLEEFKDSVKLRIDDYVSETITLYHIVITFIGLLIILIMMLAISILLKKVFDIAERNIFGV